MAFIPPAELLHLTADQPLWPRGLKAEGDPCCRCAHVTALPPDRVAGVSHGEWRLTVGTKQAFVANGKVVAPGPAWNVPLEADGKRVGSSLYFAVEYEAIRRPSNLSRAFIHETLHANPKGYETIPFFGHGFLDARARRLARLARPLAVALVVFGATFSAPAVACLCSCSLFSRPGDDAAEVEVPAEYGQIFSGLVISTERIDEPVVAPAVPDEKGVVESSGYWIKSKILVLRIWRGSPRSVAEVWTPVLTNCESPPLVGSYFSALVRTEKGRSVAGNSLCDCSLRAAATQAHGSFAPTGIAISAGAICAVAIALFSLVRIVRRRRRAG